jgi:hypothetical protein
VVNKLIIYELEVHILMRLKQRNENIMVETARIIVVLKRYGPKTMIKHVRSEKVRCT